MDRTRGNRFQRAWAELTGSAPQRESRTIYRGAEGGRLLADWVTSCLTSDEEIRSSLRLMRSRARDLARNDPLVRQFLNLLCVNVIGHRGPRLQPRVRLASGELDKQTNAILLEAFQDWATGPVSADRKLNLVQFQHLQMRTMAAEGESFSRFRVGPERRHGLALQGIDPDIVDETVSRMAGANSGEVRLGVEIDGDGAPVRYWIRDGQRYLPGDPRVRHYPLEASEVLHHFTSERASQMRGMTWLAPIMLLLQHLERYGEAELVAARAGAAAMAFIIQTDPSASSGGDENAPREIALAPGSALRLNPGEDVRDFAPNHPTTAFGPFTKGIERRIATGLAMSYNALANDLEGVNYSSIRTGLLIERAVWRMLQEAWIASFLAPTYDKWLSTSILSGALRLPRADWRQYRAHRWLSPGWPWVDPLKDAQSAKMQIDNGFTSHQRLLAERGEDFEEILEELAAEKQLAAEYQVDISGAQGLQVQPDAEDDTGDPPHSEDAAPAARSGGIDRIARALRLRRYQTNGSAH